MPRLAPGSLTMVSTGERGRGQREPPRDKPGASKSQVRNSLDEGPGVRGMGPSSYLQRLTERLGEGIARLAPETRGRHGDYLRGKQNPDGGFSGREGGSDLYYTGFALRGLAILDALTPAVTARAADFLRTSLTQQASVVDFYSLLYACLLVQASGGPDVLANSPP